MSEDGEDLTKIVRTLIDMREQAADEAVFMVELRTKPNETNNSCFLTVVLQHDQCFATSLRAVESGLHTQKLTATQTTRPGLDSELTSESRFPPSKPVAVALALQESVISTLEVAV